MREMGILDSRREGQMVFYQVNKEGPSKKCQLVTQASQGVELDGSV
jgi:DNA-binding transcriptional ArsR family regulator